MTDEQRIAEIQEELAALKNKGEEMSMEYNEHVERLVDLSPGQLVLVTENSGFEEWSKRFVVLEVVEDVFEGKVAGHTANFGVPGGDGSVGFDLSQGIDPNDRIYCYIGHDVYPDVWIQGK